MIQDTINLIDLLNKQLRHIEEKITPIQAVTDPDTGKKYVFGNAKNSFDTYIKDAHKKGKDASFITYLEEVNSEIDEFNILVKDIEKQKNITFEALMQTIANIKFKIKNEIIDEKKRIENKRAPKKVNTYRWISSVEKLTKLYEELKKLGYIPEETKLEHFELIFQNVSTSEIKMPIIWNSGSAKELLYFIITMESLELIEKKSKTQANYAQIKACFIKPDESIFNERFKSIKVDLNLTISDKTADKINQLFKKIK